MEMRTYSPVILPNKKIRKAIFIISVRLNKKDDSELKILEFMRK